tara:strand:+ start:324 stop:1097 length:774 start_codon:yes stop_codon:yes gene_type:complete
MAFQSGTTVDPRLMQADYSGFARAGEIQGQALANIGAQIGQGIEKYKKKKQDAADDEEFAQAVEPYLMNITGGDPDEAKKLGKYLRNDLPAFNAINALRKDQVEKEKLEITRNILGQVASGNITQEEAVIAGVDIETLNSFTGIGTQRLEDENIIARTGASNRSNQPKNTTYEQVRGVAKVMEEQFPDVNVDEKTGSLFIKNTGSKLNPFDTSNDAANVPGAITSMPGFEEWRKSKMSASARGEFDSSQYKMLPNPQ